MITPPLLEGRGLTKRLGGRIALDQVTLRALPGEVLAVLGANGSGKTTLLRVLAGILPACAGDVLLAGEPLRALTPRERARRVAYLPQLRELPAGFRAAGLVEMGRHPHTGESESARRRAVRQALADVGAEELAERRLETLSGGELQRVFLASIVAQRTPVLLLDEPTVFLDPGRAAEIQRELVSLAAGGCAVVLATHDVTFAAGFATRVFGLKDGRIAFAGGPRHVLSPQRLAELFDMPAPVGGLPVQDGGAAQPESGPPVREDRLRVPEGGSSVPEGGLSPPERGELPPARRSARAPLALALACAAVLLAAPLAGPGVDPHPDLGAVMDGDGTASFILWQLRVPRVLLAGAAGAALALAGAAFQALFRNPLATPYTLGVASGAALGAVLVILSGAAISLAGATGTSLGALAGALAVTAAVHGLGRSRRALPTATLLLAGVTASFFVSALILLLQYVADFTQTFRVLRWLMGEVRIVGYAPFAVFGPLIAVGGALVLAHSAELNLLLTGEELAQARGVDVERVKRRLLLGSALLVGSVVALCGPIGFVGLIVPHALRSVLGPDHRRLAAACIPAGAAFLVLCDTAARLLLAPAELPVGVVTALLGGPFFLAILLRRGTTLSG